MNQVDLPSSSSFVALGNPVSEIPQDCQEAHKPGSTASAPNEEENVSGIRVSPRECDCPPWYWACAHFESRILILNGWVHGQPRCRHCLAPSGIHIWLLYEASAKRCPRCGDWEVGNYLGGSDTPKSDALAAFHAAEEELLRGAS